MAPASDPVLHTKLQKRLDELPVLPSVLAKLMTLDREGDRFFDSVLSAVEAEPNYSVRLLIRANSAASGSREPITTLPGALARIGAEEACNLLLALGVTRVFVPRDPWEKSLWRHAIQVAIAARELARHGGDPDVTPDEAYACGLLHDMGRLVMFMEAPDQLRAVDEGCWDGPDSLLAMERAICGVDHTKLGGLACDHWALPKPIAQVIRGHHRHLPPELDDKVLKLTAVVQVADFAMFSSVIPGTPPLEASDDDTLRATVLDRLPPFVRLSMQELRELLGTITSEAEAMARELGLT
ncbi:MAG: HDOD domain-containing protein [bacterium]|nr:HDOD domain-containing protein [bacterium]